MNDAVRPAENWRRLLDDSGCTTTKNGLHVLGHEHVADASILEDSLAKGTRRLVTLDDVFTEIGGPSEP